MEQTDRRTHRTPARLVFADHVHSLIAGDGAPSSPEGAEMLTRADPSLDGPVILFQNIARDIAPVDAGNSPPERLRL